MPWSEFKKEAVLVSEDYNLRWLETEYHHTVATANMAAKWEDFKRNQDLYPNLRYQTVGDKRVRDQHAKWDGLVLPMDHPWWDTHLPPQDWGCRCDVVQTDEEVSVDIPTEEAKEGFDNNPAKTGKIFNANPYENGLALEDKEAVKAYAQEQFEKHEKKKSQSA